MSKEHTSTPAFSGRALPTDSMRSERPLIEGPLIGLHLLAYLDSLLP